jgi:hypothetical protein|tara:strand:+ start:342 stop:1316 length:975 start_codon:yes stop_codon:yes gene_type:complete
MNNAPILVTGSHRSGTTWVGKILKTAPNVFYIHEPLTPNSITRAVLSFDLWYTYFNPLKDYHQIERVLQKLFEGSYPISWVFHFRKKIPHTDYRNLNCINDDKFDYKYIKWRLNTYMDSLKIRKSDSIIPLIKDPIALTAAEWLYEKWQCRNVILMRHPAAFVSSLKRLDWRFNFENFTKQPELIDRFLSTIRSEIEDPPNDPIAEASLVWKCLTMIILDYQEIYPEWIYIRHEDLSRDPMNTFEQLCSKLDLDITEKVKTEIEKTSSTRNPQDVSSDSRVHQMHRDSKANISSWKKRLSQSEIEVVKKITKNTADQFYSDDDW